MRIRIRRWNFAVIGVALIGCGKQQVSGVAQVPTTAPSITQPVPTPICAVIDTCTYGGSGIIPMPIYDCRSTTYQLVDHPEMISLFQGETCLTTKEDWQTIQATCQVVPGVFVQCPQEIQGPGPAALGAQ